MFYNVGYAAAIRKAAPPAYSAGSLTFTHILTLIGTIENRLLLCFFVFLLPLTLSLALSDSLHWKQGMSECNEGSWDGGRKNSIVSGGC